VYQVDQDKCLGCGACVGACSRGAISLKNSKATLEQGLCDRCGQCQESCPVAAIVEVEPPSGMAEPQGDRLAQSPQKRSWVGGLLAVAPEVAWGLTGLLDECLGSRQGMVQGSGGDPSRGRGVGRGRKMERWARFCRRQSPRRGRGRA
jgi:NAD-dependent dihydropyrimidine dehydrogenase PreA subunit